MTTAHETLGFGRYEWKENESPPRLVRMSPRIEPRSWPHRVAGIAAGVAYLVAAVRTNMALIVYGGIGELVVLSVASMRSVNIAKRGREWVARDLAFVTPMGASEYRAGGDSELVVDGERVGTPTAVLLIHSTDRDPYSRQRSEKYEAVIATHDRVVVVDEGPWKEPVRELAQHIVKALGSTVPLIERTAIRPMSPEPLWFVTFGPAMVVAPFEMLPARRGLVAMVVLIAILANVVFATASADARERDTLHTALGAAAPAFRGRTLPYRYALAFALAAHALLWASILAPGGPHIPSR